MAYSWLISAFIYTFVTGQSNYEHVHFSKVSHAVYYRLSTISLHCGVVGHVHGSACSKQRGVRLAQVHGRTHQLVVLVLVVVSACCATHHINHDIKHRFMNDHSSERQVKTILPPCGSLYNNLPSCSSVALQLPHFSTTPCCRDRFEEM